jgi:4-hydroxyproline epimerase
MQRIRFVDSHTGGEPTRVIVDGFPPLRGATLANCVEELRQSHDHYRRAVCTEPRAADIVVGALLLPPRSQDAIASVIFFNNVGYLGMCGHGTIGLVTTLKHLGRIDIGQHAIDTPVGCVACTLEADGRVSLDNVVSYRYRHAVAVDVPGFGEIRGDVAWGGNWFFLVDLSSLSGVPVVERRDLAKLSALANAIRASLARNGITGKDGAEIDHIELFGAPSDPARADSRNFVLCPGAEYDRSPCGTGTSAKLACLAADGKLAAGAPWRQESIVGSVFEAHYRPAQDHAEGGIIPTTAGRAYLSGEGSLLLDPQDPFRFGVT